MKTMANILLLISLLTLLASCKTPINDSDHATDRQIFTQSIHMNDLDVDLIMEKPDQKDVDVLLVFHGTVVYDDRIHKAATRTLHAFANILEHNNIMIISVAYPEENLLIGDSMPFAEAALLWVKHEAAHILNVNINQIFLAGHSQGAYIVTRLNTLYQTAGVIANAPGPLDLGFRCQLEVENKVSTSVACTLMQAHYGYPKHHPSAYFKRSLLDFTSNYQADILFVQGLHDSPIQMHSWGRFKQAVLVEDHLGDTLFVEIENGSHSALFDEQEAIAAFNQFLAKRRSTSLP